MIGGYATRISRRTPRKADRVYSSAPGRAWEKWRALNRVLEQV